jgi:hypothetical protein
MTTGSLQTAGVGLIATLLLMAGCAQPPAEQLAAAQTAVDAAKAAGATDYAKDDFVKLEQQLALAKEKLAEQEKTLSIFRSYTEADKMLVKLVETGGQVAATAAQHKAAAKTAVLALEKEAQQAVASAKNLMGKALTGKERAVLEAIKEDIAELESSFSAVHQLIEMGDYFGAEVQAKAVKGKGAAVSGEIQRAIDKAKEMKRNAHG